MGPHGPLVTDKQEGGQIGAGDNKRDDLMPYVNSINVIINKSSVNTKYTPICFKQPQKFLHYYFSQPALYDYYAPTLQLWVRQVYLATICCSCSFITPLNIFKVICCLF